MRISVITITRNNIDGLRRTIESVQSQHYPNVEHIIVDGYSDDGTDLVLKSVRRKAVVLSRPPQGIYNAINEGLKVATGDIVGLLHAGDVFTGHEVLDIVATAFADGHCDYIYGDIHYINSYGRITRYFPGGKFNRSYIRMGLVPPHPSLYISRRTLNMIGRYREDFRTTADMEYFVRLFRHKNLCGQYLPLDMVAMDNSGISSRFTSRIKVNMLERFKALSLNGLTATPLIFVAPLWRFLRGLHTRRSISDFGVPGKHSQVSENELDPTCRGLNLEASEE